MKKYIILILYIALVFSVSAQTTIANLEPGTLAKRLEGQTGITHLIIKGQMDNRDFTPLKGIFKTFQTIDISAVKILAYNENPANVIPASAFYQNNTVQTIKLPQGITAIGEQAFNGTTQLKTIDLPQTIKIIAQYAFSNAGITRIVLPNSIDSLGNGIFSNTKNLEEVILPDKLKKIPDYTFQQASALKTLKIPETVTEIGIGSFSRCSSLKELILPEGLEWINPGNNFVGTFLGAGLVTLKFPSKTKIVNGNMGAMLSETNSLTSFNFPSNVTRFSSLNFTPSLKELIIPENMTYVGNINNSGISKIEFPAKGVDTIMLLRNTSITELKLPEGLLYLGSISGNTGLTEISLPEGLLYFGGSGNSPIKNIKLPESLTSLGNSSDGGFNNSLLTSIIIPDKVRSLGNNAFTNSKDLKSITLGLSMDRIGGNAFKDCTALDTIICRGDFPPSVTTSVFQNVDLSKVTLIVPADALEFYQQADGWKEMKIRPNDSDTEETYSWLELPAFVIDGNAAKLVGPDALTKKFTKFYINNTVVTPKDGHIDLAQQSGLLILKATTDNAAESIQLTINR